MCANVHKLLPCTQQHRNKLSSSCAPLHHAVSHAGSPPASSHSPCSSGLRTPKTWPNFSPQGVCTYLCMCMRVCVVCASGTHRSLHCTLHTLTQARVQKGYTCTHTAYKQRSQITSPFLNKQLARDWTRHPVLLGGTHGHDEHTTHGPGAFQAGMGCDAQANCIACTHLCMCWHPFCVAWLNLF